MPCVLQGISILKRSLFAEPPHRVHHVYEYPRINPGIGFCITTYTGDGSPLPSFEGGPYPVPIVGDTMMEVVDNYWSALNKDNCVSLAVKFINIKTGKSYIHVKNRFEKV